jgi:PadR family transcriptional regulator PadR
VTRTRRPSPQTVAVLAALAAAPSTWRYGYELGQEVGLKAGSLYPILIRLCDRGLLEAAWESEPAQGRPPRHLYRLTGTGVELAHQVAVTAPAPAPAPAPTAAPRRGQLRGAW